MGRTIRRNPWNEDQRRRLIGLVKQFDVLWRPIHRPNDQRMVKIRRAALTQIQRHFVGEGFLVDDIKEQWRNLRDIFYKRYELMLKRAQRGEGHFSRPSWVHFEELRFLTTPEAMSGRFRRGISYAKEEDAEGGRGATGDWKETANGTAAELGGGESSSSQATANGVKFSVKLEDSQRHHQLHQEHPDEDEEEEHYGHGQHQMESSSSSVLRGIGHPPQLQQQSNIMNSKSPMDQLTRNIDRTIQQVQQTAIKQQQVTPFQWSNSCSPNEQLSIPLQIQMRNRRTVKPQQQFAIGTGHSHQVKGAGGGEDGQQRQDRFKYFGTFVESAVRDLHQQSPELARHLMQSIYSTVSAHQMEATAGIGVDFGGGGGNANSGGSGGWINGSG